MLELWHMKTVGELIQTEMDKRGWSYRQLAQYSGVTAGGIHKVVSGKTPKPSAEFLRKIAEGLHVDVTPLLVAAGILEPAEPSEKTTTVPVIGEIRAGPPLVAIQEKDGEVEVPASKIQGGEYFYLKVKGSSMVGAGIMPESLVLVRQTDNVPSGTIAVVLLDGDGACVKRVTFEKDRVVLQSANPEYPDLRMLPHEVKVMGEVEEIVTIPKRMRTA
ncbi:MAG: LexA family protein [Armatimonadota bacterium]